jgi:hypothetical protein
VDAPLVDPRCLIVPDQQRRDAGRPAQRCDANADGVKQLAGERSPVNRDSRQRSSLLGDQTAGAGGAGPET